MLVLCALGTRGLEVKEWTEYGCGRKKVLASDVLKGKQANENFFFFFCVYVYGNRNKGVCKIS